MSRSPRATAKNNARLLEFHQECEEQRDLPPSRLQDEIRREERTPSLASLPRLMGRGLVGLDLRKEFERLGAEAQHLPLDTPMHLLEKCPFEVDDLKQYLLISMFNGITQKKYSNLNVP